MIKRLEIELRSDLCVGTGKHYAAVIDLDTALDEYGIPFVPAKRLKGCMREIAEKTLYLDESTLKKMFGESGSGTKGSLSLTDAKIKSFDDQLGEIKAAIGTGAIKADSITELFCSVRAETAIENDTAKDGSLRFIRVVNRLSPITNDPLKFFAEIEYDDNDRETVEKIVKALKNIGYKRNRGLGYVHCTLSDIEQLSDTDKKETVFDDGKRYKMDYLAYLTGDLMLPGSDANHSVDYIPGTSVLGALAAKYIKEYGEDGFNEIFYSKSVRFGNLYISDKDGNDYKPAPRFLAKIKAAEEKDSGIQNMIANKEKDDKEKLKPQYKPLKSGYVSEEKGYAKVETEIVFHNALNTPEARENNGGLYTQYCISSGQYFKGSVEADGASMSKLYGLFKDRRISFGRSKTAQYSHCIVKSLDVKELEAASVTLKKGDIAAFVFESDAVLINGGRYSVELADVLASLNEGLKTEQKLFCENELNEFTGITSRVVSGYNAKWNLKKPQFPVIRAGSAVVFEVRDEMTLPEYFSIGGRNNEGYGMIRLVGDAKRYLGEYIEKQKANGENQSVISLENSSSELLRAIYEKKKEAKIVSKAIEDADGASKEFNPSQTGRLLLMCKESKDIEDLKKRIESIKTESVRNSAEECVLKKAGEYDNYWKKYVVTLLTVVKYKLKAKEGK